MRMKQMATVLTDWKPTQTDRQGEVREGLPGSTLERGMCVEKRQELGRPGVFPGGEAIRSDGAQGIRLLSPHRGKPGPR